MGSKNKASSLAAPSYTEFEPYCDWEKEEGVVTLIVHLPSFKKDQLRVQVNNSGILKISGEKAVDETRSNRFMKETKIPEGCDINDIRAKIKNGRLHVIMPIKVPTAPNNVQQQQEKLASTSSGAPQVPKSDDTKKPKVDKPACDQEQKAPTSSAGNGSSLARLLARKKVPVSFGIATVVLVALEVYMAYKSGFSPSSSNMNSGPN